MLELRTVRKTFNPGTANEVRALDGLNLVLEPGSFTVVIGTNGSGKSTLQGVVGGALPVDAGQVLIGGTDVTAWPEHRRAALVGRVFQDPFAGTAPTLTVAENLALAGKRTGWRTLAPLLRRSARAGWRDQLAQIGLGLENRLDDPIGLLSGGQRQAITLVMAALTDPALLLLDEHTAALDPRSAELVMEVTARIAARGKSTVLMVTHSMAQAVHHGDRLVAMHRGQVRLDARGPEKRRLSESDLREYFSQVRRADAFDVHAARLVATQYR